MHVKMPVGSFEELLVRLQVKSFESFACTSVEQVA